MDECPRILLSCFRARISDLEDGVADVEVIVVLVPAHLGHQDRQVVLDAALHAESEPPVGVPLQSHVAKLQVKYGAKVLGQLCDSRSSYIS